MNTTGDFHALLYYAQSVGSLFAVSLPDLYNAIVKKDSDAKETVKTPDFPGEYKGWEAIPKDQLTGFIEIYK